MSSFQREQFAWSLLISPEFYIHKDNTMHRVRHHNVIQWHQKWPRRHQSLKALQIRYKLFNGIKTNLVKLTFQINMYSFIMHHTKSINWFQVWRYFVLHQIHIFLHKCPFKDVIKWSVVQAKDQMLSMGRL